MRRMFSKNELHKFINENLESDAVIEALAGKDVAVNDLTIAGDLALTGDATIGGDASVTGDVEIGGTLKVSEYELDQDITLSSLPSALTSYYAHARVSNGKLNIVIGLSLAAGVAINTDIEDQLIGELALSDTILSELYPYSATLLATDAKWLCYSNAKPFIAPKPIVVRIRKDTGKITFSLSQEAIAAIETYTRVARFEFNFILS